MILKALCEGFQEIYRFAMLRSRGKEWQLREVTLWAASPPAAVVAVAFAVTYSVQSAGSQLLQSGAVSWQSAGSQLAVSWQRRATGVLLGSCSTLVVP